MTCRYKVVPILLLALYGFCGVCAERILPARIALQTAVASEPHDCNKGNKHEADNQCRTLSSYRYLPSPTAQFVPSLTVQAFVTHPHAVSLVNFLHSLRARHLSTAGPPGLLNTKLRV